MPRPPRCRRICQAPQYESFSPEECPRESEAVTLTLDEYEVIRLVDLEKKTHEQCAAQMDISIIHIQTSYDPEGILAIIFSLFFFANVSTGMCFFLRICTTGYAANILSPTKTASGLYFKICFTCSLTTAFHSCFSIRISP